MPETTSTVQLDVKKQQHFDAVEHGALLGVVTPFLLEDLRESARTTGQKDQRINIRLSSGGPQAMRTRALQAGIPYQTLIMHGDNLVAPADVLPPGRSTASNSSASP